jgi:hypothetical protein
LGLIYLFLKLYNSGMTQNPPPLQQQPNPHPQSMTIPQQSQGNQLVNQIQVPQSNQSGIIPQQMQQMQQPPPSQQQQQHLQAQSLPHGGHAAVMAASLNINTSTGSNTGGNGQQTQQLPTQQYYPSNFISGEFKLFKIIKILA